MRKKIALTLLLVGVLPAVLSAHQFYISITSIQHLPEAQKLRVRVKLFVNDLEESIYQEKGIRIGLWKNNPIEDAQSYVEQYITSRLSIAINDAAVPLNFLNQKVEPAEVLEDNVILCELEANDVSEIATIKVRNSILTETFDSQANIINIRANDTRKTINLDKKLPEDEVDFR